MRYKIDFDKTVNQLVPYYLGGRNFILLLQSLMKPLQFVNDAFVEWANETRIEASMTSQVFKFEWFLNRRFEKYYQNPGDRIYISGKEDLGVPLYDQDNSSVNAQHPVLYAENEAGETVILRMSGERLEMTTYSFVVHVPAPDESKISVNEYVSMIQYQVNKYKLSGKTYIVTIY